jgi:hypothetical protein
VITEIRSTGIERKRDLRCRICEEELFNVKDHAKSKIRRLTLLASIASLPRKRMTATINELKQIDPTLGPEAR